MILIIMNDTIIPTIIVQRNSGVSVVYFPFKEVTIQDTGV